MDKGQQKTKENLPTIFLGCNHIAPNHIKTPIDFFEIRAHLVAIYFFFFLVNLVAIYLMNKKTLFHIVFFDERFL